MFRPTKTAFRTITYDYVSQDDFSTKTATVELPYYSVNHFVDTQAGKAVPDANNFYLWQYKGIQNDTSGTSFTFGDSMAKTFTEFDVVIPQAHRTVLIMYSCAADLRKMAPSRHCLPLLTSTP